MTYAVTYASKTGNTALLAETIHSALPEQACIYFGALNQDAVQADIMFIGFWTDKGTCSEDMADFLESLSNQKVFLFGSAGFGGAQMYFDQILERVSAHLNATNTIIGTYMCQGKMPMAIRTRYAAMETEHPDKARPMLENFDRALSHPDAFDLDQLNQSVVKLIRSN